MVVFKCSKAGYNAKTNTDRDNFSVYVNDSNNSVLIKEYARGSFTLASGEKKIAHNLGYVPMFKVFVNDNASAFLRYGWKEVAAQNNAFVANNYYAWADSTYLYIYNTTGVSTSFYYYIFYDDVKSGSTPSFSKSSSYVAVSKQGTNAKTSTNPNNFIMHTDLNTFKIIKQGNLTFSYNTDRVYAINHGVTLSNPTAYDVFLQFPDGKTLKTAGENLCYSYDGNFTVQDSILTTSQIRFYIARLGGSGTQIKLRYYIYDSPIAGSTGLTITPSEHQLRVAKAGYNAKTETNPDNYTFLSGLGTLQYHYSGLASRTISGDGTLKTSTATYAHNLGFVPFFTCYVDDFVNVPNANYSLAPYRNDTLTLLRRSEAYADSSNIYLRMTNKSSNTYDAYFRYKVYYNDLGF